MSMDAPDGRIGFMSGALPRVAVLKAGRIEITAASALKSAALNEAFVCGDGIVRVGEDGITVLTAFCKKADEIDKGNEQSDAKRDGAVRHEFKYAKARIASNILKMKDKVSSDDK